MEILYKREMKHNYLVIDPDQAAVFGYEAGMMVSNRIEGLLRFHIKYMDEHRFYYYEITSLQPLSRLLEGRFIRKEEIQGLMLHLHGLFLRLEEYFLGADGLLMGPEYIYADPEWTRVEFCLVPGTENDFSRELSRLLQYILKKVDHRDKESVVLSYGLYQESLKENYGIEDLMRLVGKSAGQEKEEDGGGEYGEQKETETEERLRRGRPDEAGEWPAYREQEEEKRGLLLSIAMQIGALLVLEAAGLGIVCLLKGSAAAGRLLGAGAVAAAALSVLVAGGNLIFQTAGRRGLKISRPEKQTQSWPEDRADGGTGMEDEGERQAGPAGNRGQRQEKGWEIREIRNVYGEPRGEGQDQCPKAPQPEKTDGREPVFQTVLLAREERDQELHRLEALDDWGEDIVISYFPFIIGKQEELADYILNRDTVSRLHLRLDQEEKGFTVTDLNSTNGTYVAGRMLEANETAALREGDAVGIAQFRFVFR